MRRIVTDQVDVLVIGAGPAGSCAARAAAIGGARVLMLEQRRTVGVPVQCAEYVPAQIVSYVPLAERVTAQRVRRLRTHMPDGDQVDTQAAGYVLDRALFDKALAVSAHRAGVRIWTAARAMQRTSDGVLVRRGLVSRGSATSEITCRIIIGADGPRSTVGRWIGQSNTAYIDAQQVEVVLPVVQDFTEVFFDPAYAGGYGWLFPKGETANVGVGVNRELGEDPHSALKQLLARLGIGPGAIIGRTGGPVPCGGTVARLRVGNVLLVGDAAGHTHPITGAGILAAVVSGALAGQAAAAAVRSGELTALDGYEGEWTPFMGGSLRHALRKRRTLDERWSNDRAALSDVIRENWIAFKAYGRR